MKNTKGFMLMEKNKIFDFRKSIPKFDQSQIISAYCLGINNILPVTVTFHKPTKETIEWSKKIIKTRIKNK